LFKSRKWRKAAGSISLTKDCKDFFIWFRDHLQDPGVVERIILRWIFRKWYKHLWTGFSWLRIGTGGGQL